MRVKDLIESLECYNPDAEVEIVIQQHYPLRSACVGVTSDADLENAERIEGCTHAERDEGDERVVWLISGDQTGYGSRLIWDAERR